MTPSAWLAERWLLRYVLVCGFAVPGSESIDAAVRAGAAADRLAGAEALAALLRLGLLVQIDGILFLTKDGDEAARKAARFARHFGEPAVPLPESHLPKMLWVDGDWDPVDTIHEPVTLPQRPKEASMAYIPKHQQERFSLDDPEAGRKLVESLDRHRVRLDFSELCWLFQCETYEQKSRMRNFLIGLEAQELLVEVLPDLYCRPALTKGSDGMEDKTNKPKKKKKSGRKPAAKPDAAQDSEPEPAAEAALPPTSEGVS